MGGNVTAVNKETGEEVRAEKIKVKEIGRKDFIDTFVKIFKELNNKFKSKYKRPIWVDEKILANGFAFNGSTSFIMDPSLSDDEVMKYKPTAGDIDITVPAELKEDLWKLLDSLEGKEIIPGAVYVGSNKPTISSIGEQINSVIIVEFKNGIRAKCQVDFEFLEFEGDKPTEWSKFSHSSSFKDTKAGVKAVHHKYLIRALVGGASVRNDIVIATSKSTPENITLSKSKVHQVPRMLKFSVGRGIRTAYEPMLDKNGQIVKLNGKQVYKEIPSKDSSFETVIREIYKLSFQQLKGNEQDEKLFYSFVGVIQLMKKFLNKKQLEETHKRYIELLWGYGRERGQELEVGNPQLDFDVKMAGYQRFVKDLSLKDDSSAYLEDYYGSYGRRGKMRESFRDYLEDILNEKIVKKNGKFVVTSEDGSRTFGEYDTEEEAEERLRQIHYFKSKVK
jgi:hypothetical protein